MSGAGGWVVTAAGAVLVLVALWDIFHTIWHPSGRGGLSGRLMRWTWQLGRRAGRRSRFDHLTGPVAMAVVVLVWLTLLLSGWALVYWPHLPEGFLLSDGVDPAATSQFSDAFYLSIVSLATLGFGEIVPVSTWLRIVVAVQALVGFALLTAAVSWALQVAPALTRRRALAVRLAQVRRVAGPARAPQPLLSPALLLDLASSLAHLRVDLGHYEETYFFGDPEAETSLPAMLGVAVQLAEEARQASDPQTCSAGELLQVAVEDYLHVVDVDFLHRGGSLRELCRAYAADHGHEVATAW